MAVEAKKLRAQAERIQGLRAAKTRRDGEFISQETAANKIDVSVRTYRTWEGNGADIKLKNLKALAAYYDVDPDYIVDGPPRERSSTPDLSLVGEPSQPDPIEQRLAGIEAKLDALLAREGAGEAVQEVARLLAAREWS
jgi:transcriptional regulator with XRE-family HTH domain